MVQALWATYPSKVQSASGYNAQAVLTKVVTVTFNKTLLQTNLSFAEQGDYTISLSAADPTSAEGISFGSCTVRVNRDVQCTDTVKRVGANVAFIIDNSSSHEVTDCPSPRQTGEVDQETGEKPFGNVRLLQKEKKLYFRRLIFCKG